MAKNHHEEKVALDRLVFFSDAVFAIAITLLALEIHLPVEVGPLSNDELYTALMETWPKILGFVISFLVIGSYWIVHHRRFSHLTGYDRRLVFLNLLLLMAIAFVPFPTAILSESGNRTATIFYALVMTITGLLSGVLWWYASSQRLIEEPARSRRHTALGVLVTPAIFVLSIGMAYLDPGLARLTWILIVPALSLIR